MTGIKRTKIVCTIGPACEKQATLEKMIRAGMNAARLNLSHGTYSWHARAIRTLRTAAKKTGEPLAIIADLQGHKVRLGEIKNQKSKIKNGDRIIFTADRAVGEKIPLGMKNFHSYVRKGSHLLIADGIIECVVERVAGHDIHTRVILGGELKSRSGIAIRGMSLPLPCLTAKDKQDVAWAVRHDVDFIGLSFVRRGKDIRDFRPLIPRGKCKIVAKIETRAAIANFDDILREADAIMIARGDLALSASYAEVPILQKEIIEKSRRAAKPVIVATEMLASMQYRARPTRAEASDVANAVIDHTDAVMLSAESAVGKFPVETVRAMSDIIEKTEQSAFDDLAIGREITHGNTEENIALIASVLARTSNAKAIVAGSLTGHTGRLISQYRTEMPLFVGSPSQYTVRQLNLSWGVKPFTLKKTAGMDALLRALILQVKKFAFKKGSRIIFIGSRKVKPHGQNIIGTQIL